MGLDKEETPPPPPPKLTMGPFSYRVRLARHLFPVARPSCPLDELRTVGGPVLADSRCFGRRSTIS